MIYIWIRKTLDWQDEAAFRAQLPPHLIEPVDLWNDCFKLPFHLFRDRLRQIAALNHARVEGVICAHWDAIPEGALVVPVDDDDWFAPTLGTSLAGEVERGYAAFFWPSQFLQVPLDWRHEIGRIRRRIFPATRPVWLCTTNNYAMLKRPGVRPLLEQHVAASRWYLANMDTRIKNIQQPLSLMNRSLASTTAMDRKRGPLARQKMLLACHRYRRIYSRPASAELAWSQPYREMMSGLMEELL